MTKMTRILSVLALVVTLSAQAEHHKAEHHKVVILGGGLSGLTAMYNLLHHHEHSKEDVALYEARDRFGGRAYTEKSGHSFIDMGGERIRSDVTRSHGHKMTPHHDIIELAHELKVPLVSEEMAVLEFMMGHKPLVGPAAFALLRDVRVAFETFFESNGIHGRYPIDDYIKRVYKPGMTVDAVIKKTFHNPRHQKIVKALMVTTEEIPPATLTHYKSSDPKDPQIIEMLWGMAKFIQSLDVLIAALENIGADKGTRNAHDHSFQVKEKVITDVAKRFGGPVKRKVPDIVKSFVSADLGMKPNGLDSDCG